MRYFDILRPVIVDPLSPEVEITPHTAKILPFVLTQGNERFPFVIEDASFFYRRRSDGRVEKVSKRAGMGFAGGGGLNKRIAERDGQKIELPQETPLETAIREGNEEIGVPLAVLEKNIRPDVAVTVYYGWEQHPFHVFYVAVTEEELKRGYTIDGVHKDFVNRLDISDPKLSGKKVGWARLRSLQDSILAPSNRTEREEKESRGYQWFYHGHVRCLVAILLRMDRARTFGEMERFDPLLPQIVFRQIAPHQVFSRGMMEMLKEESGTRLLYDKLPRIRHHDRLSRYAIYSAVMTELDDFAEAVISQADLALQGGLKDHFQRITDHRDSRSSKPFASLEEMAAFHEKAPWDTEENSDGEWAQADSGEDGGSDTSTAHTAG